MSPIAHRSLRILSALCAPDNSSIFALLCSEQILHHKDLDSECANSSSGMLPKILPFITSRLLSMGLCCHDRRLQPLQKTTLTPTSGYSLIALIWMFIIRFFLELESTSSSVSARRTSVASCQQGQFSCHKAFPCRAELAKQRGTVCIRQRTANPVQTTIELLERAQSPRSTR